jgi:4-amino-4-deoxy-L-arabinose transferase-like glycosyltransferase
MTRCQNRWINVVIIAVVVILRAPTLFPSLYTTDEGYYGTIANDILDGGAVYHTAVDTKPPGMYYIYAGVFRLVGRNNLFAVHLVTIFVVVATALVLRRIGARVADDWAGAWSGIGYAVFVHAYWSGDTLGANSEIFASLPLALSVFAFLRGQTKPSLGLLFVSGALVGVATLIRQPSAVTLGAIFGCLAYSWLILRAHSFARVLAAGSSVMIGFIAVIAALAWYYRLQGNLHDAYLWAWAFAVRYVGSETTFGYVLKRLVTVHLTVILFSGLLWFFGIVQVFQTVKSFWRRNAVSPEAMLLLLWFGLSYLAIFIGWRFPGHYHLAVLPPLSVLAGEAFSRFLGEQRRSPQPRWSRVRTGIIAAAALPAIGFLIVAFVVRRETLDFLPVVQQISKETSANDHIFVWGSSPHLYSFSGRRMATRFVSCTHLVGAYASRPRDVRDKGESVIPESWKMFQADWEAHPPVIIVDMSTLDPFWTAHPMTRYPVLRAYLREYRVERVINGETIYRRL